jgi:hypothetical protein
MTIIINQNFAISIVNEFNQRSCSELFQLRDEILKLNEEQFTTKESKKCWEQFLECLLQAKGCNASDYTKEHTPPNSEESPSNRPRIKI